MSRLAIIGLAAAAALAVAPSTVRADTAPAAAVHYYVSLGDSLAAGEQLATNENSDFPHGSQLADAVSFLHAHGGFVSFVTIDIGGGAVAIQANLPVILGALREAAGPDVPIVGMSYYSPRLAEWFGDPASLPARVVGVVAFNDLLEGIYGAAGDPVADVESAFSTTDTTPVGGVPLDVLRICQWTWTCVAGNLHPNDDGYAVIAHAFEDALP